MRFSTSAIYGILLSFLGGSKTAHAVLLEDAFGLINFGIQCQYRIYPRHFIYAAAENFCDMKRKMPGFSNEHYTALGLKSRNFYYINSNEEIRNMLMNFHHIVPILENGKLYPLESVFRKKSTGEMVGSDSGPDRLVIDDKCNIVGAFTDFDYTAGSTVNRIEKCRILESYRDSSVPSGRSLESPSQRSSASSRDRSPESSRQHTRHNSNEIHPEIATELTIDPPAGLTPELSRENSRFYSAERFPETYSRSSSENSYHRFTQRSHESS